MEQIYGRKEQQQQQQQQITGDTNRTQSSALATNTIAVACQQVTSMHQPGRWKIYEQSLSTRGRSSCGKKQQRAAAGSSMQQRLPGSGCHTG